MKKTVLLLSAMLLLSAGFFVMHPFKNIHHSFIISIQEPINDHEDEAEEQSGIDKQLSSWFLARAYPDPSFLDEKYMNGWRQAEALRNSMLTRNSQLLQSGMWNPLGPNNNIGGRMLSIAIDPNNGNRLFAGSASGGLWKSTDGGMNWLPVNTGLPTLGVASVVIHPANGNIIYAGTGEVYREDSTGSNPNPGNTGNNVWKTRGTYGVGILKSVDGGVTWTQVLRMTSSQMFAVQTLRFDPATPNTLYAATTDGLYRTTDAGITWNRLLNITYVTDVVVKGTTIMCAAGNMGNTIKGIFKSTDNGITWSKVTSGLPASFQGFIKFGWVPANVNDVVASIGVSTSASVELFHSMDFGTTWTGLPTSDHAAYQYWCAHDVAINPSNANRLTFAGVNAYQYTISTSSKGSLSGNIHSDIHDIQYDPTNINNLYICCDGGIYKSTNAQSATPSFTAINNGLNATQFYASMGISRTDPNMIVGGLQDNGVVMFNGLGWNTVSWVGGDGTTCAIDPNNDNNILASRDARAINRSTDGGLSGINVANYWGTVADSRTAFVAPMAYSKSNSAIVYCATDNLHKSTNGGSTWSNNSYGTASNYIEGLHKTAIALAVSPVNANKVYVSTSSFAQYDNNADGLYYTGLPGVLKTTTGNTPFNSINGSGVNVLPDRYVMDFAISNSNDDSVFAAVAGFGTQHIYVTGDGGLNWTPAGVGLPDVPFNTVLIDPVNPKVIYAGGDLGVYVSPDRGMNWYDYNTGLWDATQVTDLEYAADFTLVAATHGKGMFRSARFSGILPVKFISFNGEARSDENRLSWKVEQQVNVVHYELERKREGATYQVVSVIPATNATSYFYEDVLTQRATLWYRLKCIDIDGGSMYSSVVVIRRNTMNGMQVVGNPFDRQLVLHFTLPAGTNVCMRLYDGAGKLIRQEKAELTSGQSRYVINDLDRLPAGSYFVEAVADQLVWKQQVIKVCKK